MGWFRGFGFRGGGGMGERRIIMSGASVSGDCSREARARTGIAVGVTVVVTVDVTVDVTVSHRSRGRARVSDSRRER